MPPRKWGRRHHSQDQQCCGALAWHINDETARKINAVPTLKAFPSDVDAIITNAAGCGSGLHEYSLNAQGEPEEKEAEQFALRVKDITVFWTTWYRNASCAKPRPVKLTYQDACHLRHASVLKILP